MSKKEVEKHTPKSRTEWRNWLEKNHQTKHSVWLVYYRTSSDVASITWSEAVDEAICFGWIDSTKKTIDEERYMQYFSKRKPSSTWSLINKEKVDFLIRNNLMAKAGLEVIKTAKQNGNWSLMDDVEKLIIPDDLNLALGKKEGAMDFYQSQTKSTKKMMLYWVVMAKRIETRTKRINEIVESAAKGLIPNQFK
ncbi:YdeI/OmpD-associated family protein [Portibacter lacus]|uniref:Bacteriocin-protection protein n=1 Tax=Portibacter lacus TaxID=1099794 RepID=A0AA37SR08_9BACT|nr:YdeI/OmpD-associated family protein [Portibacter lacus]GLR18262.1 hypothetical protein GCM10007940_28780 [Portibacter lacus]